MHTGIFSLGICDYLDFDTLGKKFWLLDTFNGIPVETLTTEEERVLARAHNENIYFDCYAVASENFAPFKNCHLVRGTIPQSLAEVPSEQISYLHIDLNNAEPEAAALEYFWPKLVSGGIVLLDDYGWSGHRRPKEMIDAVAKGFGVSVLTLPTGQGMILKP